MKKWQFMPVTPSIVGDICSMNKSYKKVTLYVSYPLYSGNTLLCARYPFFSFFFLLIVLWKSNISAIKRVVKHEKMAIYVCYPLYSWKHNFEELYAPYPIYSGNTLLCARYPFFSFFYATRFIENILCTKKEHVLVSNKACGKT